MPFGPVMSKNEFYQKIWLCQLFEIYICKKSEKSNAQILRKVVNRHRDKQVERQIMFYSTIPHKLCYECQSQFQC